MNLDGDVVRGTLQFERYPRAVILDGRGTESELTGSDEDPEGFVLATMIRPSSDGDRGVIEIQRWDTYDGGPKEWMEVPRASPAEVDLERDSDRSPPDNFGLRTINANVPISFPEIGELLRGRRLRLNESQPAQELTAGVSLEEWERSRNKEEVEFGRRLGGRVSRLVLWSGSSVWWIVRNPLAMKLDATINEALLNTSGTSTYTEVDRSRIIQVVNIIRGQEAVSETEFLSLKYIFRRQVCSCLLISSHGRCHRPAYKPPT